MYLRTKEGLGPDQETWSAPQPLNRVMVRPVPIGYLGNFHGYLGSPKQTCYIVANFGPNSWGLPVDLQKDIQKIANDIVGKIEHKLRKLRLKRGQAGSVHLYLDFRAHMDKDTDTNLVRFYEKRGVRVRDDLHSRIQEKLKDLHDRFNFSYFMDHNYEPQGSTHPVSSTLPSDNRRVEVCILNLRVTKV